MELIQLLLGFLLVMMVSSHRISKPEGQAVQGMSWQYLRANIKDKDAREIKAWQAAYPGAFEKLDCSIIPAKFDESRDMAIIEAFGSRLINQESCLKKVIEVLIGSRVSAQTFGKFIFARKDWIPEPYWSTVLALLKKHIPKKEFPDYYLRVIECFDFVEAMAPHFRPALDGLTEEPSTSIVRFTPLYFILAKVDAYIKRRRDEDPKALKEQDQYSAKLRQEFATILEVQPEEPVSGYLQAAEFYLDATQYLRRALLNEQDYFNLDLWLRKTFLRNSRAEDFILDNDLYRLIYLLYLTGIDEAITKRMKEKCAVGCLSLYLGRNRPEKFEVTNESCLEVKRLARIYKELQAPDKTIVPCRAPKGKTNLQTVVVPSLGSIRATSRNPAIREAYLLTHMMLMRLFEVPFDYVPMNHFKQYGREQVVFMNATLKDYCSALHMDPAVTIFTAAPSTRRPTKK